MTDLIMLAMFLNVCVVSEKIIDIMINSYMDVKNDRYREIFCISSNDGTDIS